MEEKLENLSKDVKEIVGYSLEKTRKLELTITVDIKGEIFVKTNATKKY